MKRFIKVVLIGIGVLFVLGIIIRLIEGPQKPYSDDDIISEVIQLESLEGIDTLRFYENDSINTIYINDIKQMYPKRDSLLEVAIKKELDEIAEKRQEDSLKNVKLLEEASSNQQRLLAYNYAKNFVTEKLKAPSSADFPGLDEKLSHVSYIGDLKYQIISWVESQNSFGVMIRSQFSCIIRFEGDNVYCTELIIN